MYFLFVFYSFHSIYINTIILEYISVIIYIYIYIYIIYIVYIYIYIYIYIYYNISCTDTYNIVL